MKDKRTKSTKRDRMPEGDRFQPKALLVWLVIFTMIIGLWSFYPVEEGAQKAWGMQRVVESAKLGEVTKAVLKADPARGPEWYVIKGEAKVNHGGDGKVVYFTAQGRLTEQKFNELMESASGNNIVQKPASTFMSDLVLSLLPFLVVILLLYFLFARQMKMAGRGAMSFGKSKARRLTRDDRVATFADVAGCDESKEEVAEVVEFLKNPKKFQKIGAKIPKGVLLVGPPGTGKTLLARAVAGEAHVPFFTISGSDFVEMFVGVGASRVRDLFKDAEENAPCIVFIDEIDAVGRQRGAGLGGGNDEREQTLNALLVEMDGFSAHKGIIVMAATNRPDVLDSALLRPGRFDRQVVIDLPDLIGRREILKVHAKKIKIAAEVDLEVVARNTPGFAGADLENLLNEAALIAARHDKSEVEMWDLDEAREKIAYGRERKKLMDEEDKKITAYHEAGHALIQAVIDDGTLPIHKVTIIPRGQSLGSTMFLPKKDILNQTKTQLLNRVCCAMGGRIAEDMVFKEITTGASGDILMVTKLVRDMVCKYGMSSLGFVSLGGRQDHIFLGKEITRSQDYSEETAQRIDEEVKKMADEQYQRGYEIMVKHRKELDTIANALLQYETIEGKHVKEIMETGVIQTAVVGFPRKGEKEVKKDEVTKEGSGVGAGEAEATS